MGRIVADGEARSSPRAGTSATSARAPLNGTSPVAVAAARIRGIATVPLLPCRHVAPPIGTRTSPMTRRTLWGFAAGCFAGGMMVAVLTSGALHGQAAKSGAGLET